MFSLKKQILTIWCYILISLLKINGKEIYNFPSNFSFGVATAAYQIEGAWNLDGKGPNIWDAFTHLYPELIKDRSNADIGPDSYHQFHQDLNGSKHLGVQFYRFSISWARILPTGDVSSLNQAGINYYNDVINKLLASGIKPMVTMFHYDLPYELHKIGGPTNPLFINYFEEYARVLYKHFGDRVKHWITFNQPLEYCVSGYGKTRHPPLVDAHGVGEYLCVDHTIKAHAVAYRLYRKDFYNKQQGKIGITLHAMFYYSRENDSELVDRAMQFGLGWLTHPIYSKSGGYPQIMVEVIGNNSKNEGRAWSRLPVMDDHWKNIVKGAGDFIGINYYTARLIEKTKIPPQSVPSWESDSMIATLVDPSWKQGNDWLYSVPKGLRDLMRWVRDEYDNTEVIITENGWPDEGQLIDNGRIEYLTEHLQQLSEAIKEGCNISAYISWSLIDNFEWLDGYSQRFGLYYVNMSSPNKERIPKKSVEFFKKLVETRKLSTKDNGNSVVML